MSYRDELVWATHKNLKKPVKITRGMLEKKRRLGWRELEGDYNGKENKKEVCKKKDFQETTKEKSDEYNRLISQGIIREFNR